MHSHDSSGMLGTILISNRKGGVANGIIDTLGHVAGLIIAQMSRCCRRHDSTVSHTLGRQMCVGSEAVKGTVNSKQSMIE